MKAPAKAWANKILALLLCAAAVGIVVSPSLDIGSISVPIIVSALGIAVRLAI